MAPSPKLLVGIALLVGACKRDPNSALLHDIGETCAPGHTVACVGANSCSGAQICKEDGTGYLPCECASAPRTMPDVTRDGGDR